MDALGFLRRPGRLGERGEAVVEYALIASLMVVALLSALDQFSGANNEVYDKVETAISAMSS